MKLSGYNETYEWFSGKASDVARTAAFAGLGLVWIFRQDKGNVPTLPERLVLPTCLFAIAIALDLLQYVVGSLTWGIFFRHHERKLKHTGQDPELDHSPMLLWPMEILYLGKIALIFIAFGFVVAYLFSVW